MNGSEIFLLVKKHIDRMDHYGLLAGGAPHDEFDGESRKICQRLRPDQSAREIAAMIAEVFNSAFDGQDDAAAFLPAAEQIKKDIAQ